MSQNRRDRSERTGSLTQLLVPLLVTCASVAMLMGGFLLSQLESPEAAALPTEGIAVRSTLTPFLPTFTPSAPPTEAEVVPSPTPVDPSPVPATAEPTPMPSPIPTEALAPTEPPSPPPPPPCGPPSDWVAYTVRRHDTLYSLARHFEVDTVTLQRANCLLGYAIRVGQELYVPPGVASPAPGRYPAPVLLSPDNGAQFPPGQEVPVRWTWDGALGEDEYFDVRLWQEGAPHYGVGWSRDEAYAVVGEPGAVHYWSVAVIRGKDGRMLEQLSPESPPRRISWGSVD